MCLDIILLENVCLISSFGKLQGAKIDVWITLLNALMKFAMPLFKGKRHNVKHVFEDMQSEEEHLCLKLVRYAVRPLVLPTDIE